ncbi:CatB-related O-acetyltransferase [Lutibacter oricola]|uniref:CatB-related O-acetyltransferase n=1 Tax=Lutibacter oricola TaxID=762486 RepID=UPI00158777F2|nr:CatB-related O-acetyltransferase [Lutibacter oricola]
MNNQTVLKGKNIIYSNAKIKNAHVGLASYIGPKTNINYTYVGRFCSIGPRVRVIQGMHPSKKFVSTHPSFFSIDKQCGFTFVSETIFEEYKYSEKQKEYYVDIGSDVWIGGDATILAGVSIGHGAIIASNSNIVKSIPPYEIWGGNPARFIRKRFTDEEIERLLEVRWWDKSFTQIELDSIKFENIESFLNDTSEF